MPAEPGCAEVGRQGEKRIMQRYAMGIDFGSTTAKVVILDEDGEVAGSAISQ